ncbi:hypothetical protein ACN2XU_16625, partial [Primorskyibacter sp. 2E107]|uniref:hypothetical protein n=1 Tax=Primorskyibacter sp. 2E107 TaxID=3403458 RepID=UPI003AF846F7
QINEPVDGAQQVAPGHVIRARELLKHPRARTLKTTPIAPPAAVPSSPILQPYAESESAESTSIKGELFNEISPLGGNARL